jgi:hypothetical protein
MENEQVYINLCKYFDYQFFMYGILSFLYGISIVTIIWLSTALNGYYIIMISPLSCMYTLYIFFQFKLHNKKMLDLDIYKGWYDHYISLTTSEMSTQNAISEMSTQNAISEMSTQSPTSTVIIIGSDVENQQT